MSREALVLLVCCCDFRDRAERLIPSKSLRNAVIWAFPGLLCILRMCAPRRAAAVVRPRGREKSADRRRRILISRLLIIRVSVPRWKSPFPAYFKGFPAVSLLFPPYPAFLKYPVSPQIQLPPQSDTKHGGIPEKPVLLLLSVPQIYLIAALFLHIVHRHIYQRNERFHYQVIFLYIIYTNQMKSSSSLHMGNNISLDKLTRQYPYVFFRI